MTDLLPGISLRHVDTARVRTGVLVDERTDGEAVVLVHGNVSSSIFWQETMLALPAWWLVRRVSGAEALRQGPTVVSERLAVARLRRGLIAVQIHGDGKTVVSFKDITLDDGRRVPRPDGVQDTASQFVELSHQFANALIRLAKGTVVSFSMARPGGVDAWVYDVTERVVLDTPGYGPVEAFHLVPRPQAQPRGNITAEMWFAPSLQYLPVKIRIQQGNEIHMDLVVERIDQAETKPGS